MLQKWKLIIKNWINCYFDESIQDERNVNVESLLNIISHLRESLNLDESKSSVLAAHTVEEFILEKYPGFKFENGSTEAVVEDDTYLVASLLLFFVCVNSKHVDIKSAMCSKLSVEDQEIIMKFSKSLMESSTITYSDVQGAITEACGQDIATIDSGHVMVAETPPALRSLHGEVRRLQAALDAERFDRNYLQEELARTNSKLEKLVKDKEQYKQDIMNLKAKLSQCGGEQDARGTDTVAEESAKLRRQLEDMEEHLVKTSELLDDTLYERNSLKTKVEELKQDRDKWIALSQEESTRAAQLAEELEMEKRHLQSLRELVTELRQHNRLNGLDASQLECDDPDASMQSFGHNLSVCSEACANVIEVQLSEERARVNALMQQIETLEKENEQLHFAIEEDNSNREVMIKEKDGIIDNLEQQLKDQTVLLELLRKDHEDVTLSWEKYKLETRAANNEKDGQIMRLNDYLASLRQDFAELEETKNEMVEKNDVLMKEMAELERKYKIEKEKLIESLTQLESKYTAVMNEKDSLHNQLVEENTAKNILHNQLVEEKAAKDVLETEKKYLDENYKILVTDNNSLLNEKIILAQQLAEEKSLRQIIEEQKKALSSQNTAIEKKFTKQLKHIEKKMAKEVAKTKTLLQDKERLTQQLNEERLAKQTAEKEKKNFMIEKNLLEHSIIEFKNTKDELCQQVEQLIAKQDCLEQEYLKEQAMNQVLNQEKEQLIQSLTEEMSSRNLLLKENESVVNENEGLKRELLDQTAVQGELLSDKEQLLAAKEQLIKSLGVEKSSRDEVENEKNELSSKLNELNEQYASEVRSKQAELAQISDVVKQLQAKCEELSLENENYIIKLDEKMREIESIQHQYQTLSNEFNDMKAQLENEIQTLNEKLMNNENATDEMKQSYVCQITQLQNETKHLQCVVYDTKMGQEEFNKQISNILNVGLERLVQDIKQGDITNEDLLQLINIEVDNISVTDKCNLLINIADTLTCEVVDTNKAIEQEKSSLAEVTQVLEQKEMLITDLQSETEHLQRIVNEIKIELAKLNESYTNTIDSKTREIELIQQENQTRTNDFNDTKAQIESEIHSLKEKMADHDYSTGKMKETYVSQIIQLQEETDRLQQLVYNTRLGHEKTTKEITNLLNLGLEQLIQDLNKENITNEDMQKLIDIEVNNTSVNEKCNLLLNIANTLTNEVVDTKRALELEKTALKELNEVSENNKNQINDLQTETKRLQQVLNETVIGQEELNKQLSTMLNVGLERLIQDIRKAGVITNDIEEKLSHIKELDSSVTDKCDLFIDVTGTLTTKVIMKNKTLENENAVLAELRETLKHKDVLITELQTETKRLQQVVNETKTELSKQKETFTTTLNNKLREIEVLQQENQSLTTDFNEVKVQLNVKVHSLKEKLIDNENLTDKLKKAYECQIDNLNIMVTKLTNYLKDKANELEVARKEKDRLQQVIEENNEAIKALEEEVKTEKQNQEKLINDFESERQVLKNMVTVTESVMEDQKLTLNNAISEQVKANEMLQEENSSIKEELENKVKDFEIKMQEKEKSLGLVQKELAEIRTVKEGMEKQIIALKEMLNKEIISLKNEIQKKEEDISKLKEDNNQLETIIKGCKDNIVLFQKENDELKNKMDTYDVEYHGKVNKLTESLNEQTENKKHLNDELNEKNKTILEMEIKLENLESKISSLEQEKAEFIWEKDSYLVKINEIQDMFEIDSLKYTQEISKLKKDNTELSDEISKITKNNTELAMEVSKIKKTHAELATEMGKSQKHEAELSIEISKMKKDNSKLTTELSQAEKQNSKLSSEMSSIKKNNAELATEISKLQKYNIELQEEMEKFATENTELTGDIGKLKKHNTELMDQINEKKKDNNDLEAKLDKVTKDYTEIEDKFDKLKNDNSELGAKIADLEIYNIVLEDEINQLKKLNTDYVVKLDKLEYDKEDLTVKIGKLEVENTDYAVKINQLENEKKYVGDKIGKLEKENTALLKTIEDNKTVISNLEQAIKAEQEQHKQHRVETAAEKLTLVNKCDILEDYHTKAEKELEERRKEIVSLQKEVQTLQSKIELSEKDNIAKDGIISKMSKEKDAVINQLNKELSEEKALKEKCQGDVEDKVATICQLKENLDKLNSEREALRILKKENQELIKAVGQRETFAVRSQENTASQKFSGQFAEKELRDIHHQVDNTSDLTHSSMESLKTISDLEKIINDKNRTITTLQSDVTYLKTLMAESENKLLDVTKELEVSKENCHQLSSQLKKIVHQKNEEMAELKKQVSKMTATENRASQIIKVSAKYQAIILKRIAEIKSNTVLKELTNFGNTNNNCDNELRRSLTAGSITMEDLENFLETTERHLKKCSEKQLALQKERDRLAEVNRINDSEIINLKKFLTELSISFQTFSSVKDLYAQKLSRVISVQRTVRREILSLDGHITDVCMLKLERGYAAVMQDLAECAMNLERWVERCIGRTISSEKIKQAFLNDTERSSLAPTSLQNAGLEVQLDELENSFQKLLEEVSRAQKGEGARDSQAVTVMEVRAEYEDKLNRMKAKMKQLYTEQIAVFKEKQKEEIVMLERELSRARDKLAQSSRAYEEHIRGLTTELWSVGEKFLKKKDEAEWLRRKQRSGSLMSLQHVHSSGLVPTQEEPRQSDTCSLRSLPIKNNGNKQEGRVLHMSDEEGEVFDNRWLKELAATPRREAAPTQRLSELRWRNSLCPPHLKSSYPAETQFAQVLDEDEIKAMGAAGAAAVRNQRKEVGITAYKKPGPPTPSKQAGRLSATDSELRESLRVEAEPQPSRKTSTPSRIRSLFRSSKAETTDGTPRSRRLSNIFRKK